MCRRREMLNRSTMNVKYIERTIQKENIYIINDKGEIIQSLRVRAALKKINAKMLRQTVRQQGIVISNDFCIAKGRESKF